MYNPAEIIKIYKGKAFDNFKDSIGNDITATHYIDRLRFFLQYNKLASPDQLLELSLDELEDMIKKHTVYLQKEIYSNS